MLNVNPKVLPSSGSLLLEDQPIETNAVGNYIVFLINSTDYVVRKIRLNSTNNADPWTDLINPIGRTCNSIDYQSCFGQQAWRELAFVDPGQTYKIEVGYQKNGKWWRTSWDSFYSDPAYPGGVIIMDNG